MADYPLTCRSKGTRILADESIDIDENIDGRYYGISHSPDKEYFNITSVNQKLTTAQKDEILDHYRSVENLHTEFNWSWATDNNGTLRTFVVMYIAPPKRKWTKDNRWTVTSRLYGYDTTY